MARLLDWLAWAPAGIYLIGSLAAAATGTRGWTALVVATRCALAAALVCGLRDLLAPGSGIAAPAAAAAPIVLTLIAFLGWIIGDYSRRYLRGEPGQKRFAIAFLATLAAVSAVVVSPNLGVLIAAWTTSSAGLHHLLTFYPERPAALLVAHKKFLASRLAEGLLIAAAVLLYREWGTLDLSTLTARAASVAVLPLAVQAAAVLIAAATLLKCAQLPLHGWLLQVMEAPTPVSALLHAGIVNLGGYVLIRLAPLIGASLPAQALLVVAGSLTAALAGLVMLTRVTIKVRLAWSTCSQLGFMVMECGLGLYDLALLHLVAHSLYKAHAFLTAGEAVRDGLERQIIARSAGDAVSPKPLWQACSPLAAWIIITVSADLWHRASGLPPLPGIATALLALGLATLLWSPALWLRPNLAGLSAVAVGTQVYLGWHWVLAGRLGIPAPSPSPVLSVWALLVFAGLYATQASLSQRPPAARASRFYDWIYAGLYLDERFTRLTFRLWPPRTPSGNNVRLDDPNCSSPRRTP